MNIQVPVTQDHIDKGEKCNKAYCPIGLALRDAGYRQPIVHKRSCEFYQGVAIQEYPLPHQAVQFIYDYDAGEEVAPFTLVLANKE